MLNLFNEEHFLFSLHIYGSFLLFKIHLNDDISKHILAAIVYTINLRCFDTLQIRVSE